LKSQKLKFLEPPKVDKKSKTPGNPSKFIVV